MHRYSPTPEPISGSEAKAAERDTAPTNYSGTPLMVTSYRYWVAITPSASLLANIPDAIWLTVDANVTMSPADSSADTPVLLALKAGENRISPAKVTVVSAGTAYACYTRKPT